MYLSRQLFFGLLIGVIFSCQEKQKDKLTYETENLKIEALSKNAFVHISKLDIPNYGKFPCNGLVFKDQGEALIFDCPIGEKATRDLIDWVENKLDCQIVAIVVNHFHVDCLGTLDLFHQKNIPSYANQATIELAKKEKVIPPRKGFGGHQSFPVGRKEVIHQFFGEAHTSDNIVSYIPSEQLLFGGCMIKEMGAGKGNLADANIQEWANTVRKVKKHYPDLEIIVPGHGQSGGTELLDYTIQMFEKVKEEESQQAEAP